MTDNEAPTALAKTTSQAVHARTTETLDLVSIHAVEECNALIKELEGIKDFMLKDCGRVKAEVAAHIDTAGAMREQINAIREFVNVLKGRRVEMIRARVE